MWHKYGYMVSEGNLLLTSSVEIVRSHFVSHGPNHLNLSRLQLLLQLTFIHNPSLSHTGHQQNQSQRRQHLHWVYALHLCYLESKLERKSRDNWEKKTFHFVCRGIMNKRPLKCLILLELYKRTNLCSYIFNFKTVLLWKYALNSSKVTFIILQKNIFQINTFHLNFMKESWKMLVSTKIFVSATVFNIDNNQKCVLSIKSAYQNDFWRSCDTEDWSNDAENTALITEINYILTYIHIG